MYIQGQVGPQVLSDGAIAEPRQDRSGSFVVVEGHGRYYEAAYRRNLFTAYAAAATLSAAATSMTGLILINPNGNSKNLALQKTGGFLAVTSATDIGVTLGYFAQGSTTFGGTTLTAANALVSNFLQSNPQATAEAYVAVNAIAVAPTPFKTLLHNTAAIATTGEDPGWQVDLEGSIIIPPGFGVALCAVSAASAASALYADISWEEVPV